MRSFRSPWGHGQVVYLVGRAERLPGVVISITFTPGNAIYEVRWADGSVDSHYELELREEFEPNFAAE